MAQHHSPGRVVVPEDPAIDMVVIDGVRYRPEHVPDKAEATEGPSEDTEDTDPGENPGEDSEAEETPTEGQDDPVPAKQRTPANKARTAKSTK